MARRSISGLGRICGIYTLGPEEGSTSGPLDTKLLPAMTGTIGEDFADCKWPVTVKTQEVVTREVLSHYVHALHDAVHRGFFMDPSSGAAILWRWDGTVPPGIAAGEGAAAAQVPRRSIEQTLGTGRRSSPGRGRKCSIYLLDEARNWKIDEFYGRLRGSTAISGSVDEDYASSSWPVVVKVHSGVTHRRFETYLEDLAAELDDGFFIDTGSPPF